MRLVGLLFILVGMVDAMMGFATVAHQPETWLMDGLGLAGIAAIGLGIFVVVWKTRSAWTQGFEVKITTGGTPVLLKENNHG